jgi:hypothetical protein
MRRVAGRANRFDYLRKGEPTAVRENSAADVVSSGGASYLSRVVRAVAFSFPHRAERHPDRRLSAGPNGIVLLHEGRADNAELYAAKVDGEFIGTPDEPAR